MKNFSPLRYPGGKSKISPLLSFILKTKKINGTYIEPFAGGAGVALNLLFNGVVDNIVINDYDKCIYSFWRAIKESGYQFIDLIEKTPININEWKKQRDIYLTSKYYSLELGFATFYLNRTNRSGILTAGPIGGFKQNGNYKIDARFNKEILIDKISNIIAKKNNIFVYNKDISKFIKYILPKFEHNAFVYFDPPYFNKGQQLYKNFLEPEDHKQIAKLIFNQVDIPWIVSYDNIDEIKKIYSDYLYKKFFVNYSAANTGKVTELIIFSDNLMCPKKVDLFKIGIDLI